MKLRVICICSILFALCVTAAWAADAHQAQEGLAEKMVRLHVLANSDSDADQALKLQVRDAVLARAETVLRQSEDMAEAEDRLRADLDELAGLARAVVAAEGYSYPVSVALDWEDYPTRTYDTFTLPAGRYLSLRVEIGAGAGRNWWCVVFPPLCTAATTEDFAQSAEAAGLTEDELSLITQETGGYVVRFKAIEVVEGWLSRLR